MTENDRLAIAAHLHVLLRRNTGRVTDTEWLALVFAVGFLVVLWVIGHWWSEGF